MPSIRPPLFESNRLYALLEGFDDKQLDELSFGVIGFDGKGLACRYNAHESLAANLAAEEVLGRSFFSLVAPCMDNYLVAQRFEIADAKDIELNAIIDYVLSCQTRPVRVKLRLLSSPAIARRYVLVQRAL